MSRIAIVASGTRGDVQPYVALGKGLQEAGFSVRVLTGNSFEWLVREAGLDYGSTGESVEAMLETEAWRKRVESGNFLRILSGMREEMKRASADLARRLPDLLAGSDLIITGTAGLIGVLPIAEMMQIPYIQANVFPFTPTSAFPSPLVPALPLGGALNRLSFHVTRQMFWQSSKTGDQAVRLSLNLPKGPMFGPFRRLTEQRTPVMYGYSRHILPHPHDWPDTHAITGYWFLETPVSWSPPADLVRFLDAGDPPVYIGFGSMGSRNPQAMAEIALEALALTGQRGVLASGWGGLTADSLPGSVHMIASMPHAWLFERMATVVHHGGAGTTAAGFRAGVPSIIIPFMADQPFWGKRAADLGVGPAPIPRKTLTARRLADAISVSVNDRAMRQRAQTLGEQIRAEDGIGQAVAFVERHFRPRP